MVRRPADTRACRRLRRSRRGAPFLRDVTSRQHDLDAAWALSLACARHAAGAEPASTVASAAADVSDLPLALDLAAAQGLGPLLARALRDGNASTRAAELARESIATSTARTLGQVRLLTRVCGALDAAGGRALPYKGPVLSLQLYGDVALRTSTDLDLVVPRAAYDTARAVLGSLRLAPRGGHSVRQERTLFRWLGHASFGTGSDEFVELHWRFAPLQFPFALRPERALARASAIRIAGQSLPVMAPDALVVTLAMHGGRHLYERLEWLAGVSRLLLARPEAADELLAHAASLRARRT